MCVYKYECGAGYTMQQKKKEILHKSINLPPISTVFQAEVIAINEACKCLLRNRTRDMKYIKIFSNSQAAMLAIANITVLSKLVQHTIESLNNLAAQTHRVKL